MNEVLVFADPKYIYGDHNGGTVSRKVIKLNGEWLTLNEPVESSISKTTVVHKSRVIFVQDQNVDDEFSILKAKYDTLKAVATELLLMHISDVYVKEPWESSFNQLKHILGVSNE